MKKVLFTIALVVGLLLIKESANAEYYGGATLYNEFTYLENISEKMYNGKVYIQKVGILYPNDNQIITSVFRNTKNYSEKLEMRLYSTAGTKYFYYDDYKNLYLSSLDKSYQFEYIKVKEDNGDTWYYDNCNLTGGIATYDHRCIEVHGNDTITFYKNNKITKLEQVNKVITRNEKMKIKIEAKNKVENLKIYFFDEEKHYMTIPFYKVENNIWEASPISIMSYGDIKSAIIEINVGYSDYEVINNYNEIKFTLVESNESIKEETKKETVTKKEEEKPKTYTEYLINGNVKYTWEMYDLNGNLISIPDSVNTSLLVDESKNTSKIKDLINENEELSKINPTIKILTFKHEGNLGAKTHIHLYVGDKFVDGTIVSLVYFNEKENKFETMSDNNKLKVVNGYIDFDIYHCSEYILLESEFVNKLTIKEKKDEPEYIDYEEEDTSVEKKSNIWIAYVLIGVSIVTLASTLGYLYYKKKKENR